jgi:hypothetical protein
MDDDRVAAIQFEQLMLSTALDAFNASAFGTTSVRGRESFFERRMNRADAGDGFPERGFG